MVSWRSGWAHAGSVISCGTRAVLAPGVPRGLGVVAPAGGVLLLAGWALLDWAAREPGR